MAKTANRPSESHREWVKNSKGERVRNTAYKKPSRVAKTPNGPKVTRYKDVMRDVLHGDQVLAEQPLGVVQTRAILKDPTYDAYGPVRLYGTIAEGESKGQRVAIKSEYHLDRFKYSSIEAKGERWEVQKLASEPFGDFDVLEAYTDGDKFHDRCAQDLNKVDPGNARDVYSGSLAALKDCVDPADVDKMTDHEIKELWSEAAAAYAGNLSNAQWEQWSFQGADPEYEPEQIDPDDYREALIEGDEVPRDILAGRQPQR